MSNTETTIIQVQYDDPREITRDIRLNVIAYKDNAKYGYKNDWVMEGKKEVFYYIPDRFGLYLLAVLRVTKTDKTPKFEISTLNKGLKRHVESMFEKSADSLFVEHFGF